VTGDWENPDPMLGVNANKDERLCGHPSPVAHHLASRSCLIVNLGLIGYAEAGHLQQRLVAARKAAAVEDVLLLCEHPNVVTLGRNGKRENLLASDRVLQQKGVEFYATNRGGDITYHGPGQIVGYPILNLAAIRRDVGWYVRMLEEAMIRASANYGVTATREEGKTGIWVSGSLASNNAEKLGAIGVHLSRWITSHGFAFNVSTDLRYFDLIVPCGIVDRKATSLEKLLNRRIDKHEVTASLVKHFSDIFGFHLKSATPTDLFHRLEQIEGLEPIHQPAAVSA